MWEYNYDHVISIHALRGEGDFLVYLPTQPTRNFYPRPPWGGRRIKMQQHIHHHQISIHALRGEGDNRRMAGAGALPYFYPRPPWGGRRRATRVPSRLM